MNAKSLIAAAALALVATTGAVAQEATSDSWMHAAKSSTTTRAEVKAELARARADGSLSIAAEYNPFDRSVASVKNRDRVHAEKPVASTKTRAEVKAEVLQAIANGELLSQGDRS